MDSFDSLMNPITPPSTTSIPPTNSTPSTTSIPPAPFEDSFDAYEAEDIRGQISSPLSPSSTPSADFQRDPIQEEEFKVSFLLLDLITYCFTTEYFFFRIRWRRW